MRIAECGLLIGVSLGFQSAFSNQHSAMVWCRWRDSNPHNLVSKTSASSHLGYTGVRISDFGLRIGVKARVDQCTTIQLETRRQSAFRIPKSAILLVDL